MFKHSSSHGLGHGVGPQTAIHWDLYSWSLPIPLQQVAALRRPSIQCSSSVCFAGLLQWLLLCHGEPRHRPGEMLGRREVPWNRTVERKAAARFLGVKP